MCGIAGYIDFKKSTDDQVLGRMSRSLRHRGPDDSGVERYQSQNAWIGFAHARLAVIDLKPTGHQPMHHENYSVVYNGEIYNYVDVRRELEALGHIFKSQSDTEVILQAFQRWGTACVNRFIGMFAFVIYDRNSEKVFFCRDRTGVKPLYYYWANDLIIFGSEMKVLLEHPGFVKKISSDALFYYIQYSYVPGPLSIFENCYKIEPGHWNIVDLKSRTLTTEKYWDLHTYFSQPLLDISYEEARDSLQKLIKSACQYRMVSDVPVGIFLSGGYDSAGITGILQADRTEKLKTFTIGFPDGVNEAPFAREIADYLGTDHMEFDCSIEEAKKVIPELPYFFDEPFADISAIPTIMVSRLARQHVTVALSGDGGDELFAGYGGFSYYFKLRRFERTPAVYNTLVSYVLSGAAAASAFVNPFYEHKIQGFATALMHERQERVLALVHSKRTLPGSVNRNLFKRNGFPKNDGIFQQDINNINDPYHTLLLSDYVTSLRDQLLVKTDRATMSASLEGREPLLDHRLAEFTARLPLEFKISGARRKIIFKDIVHQYLPSSLMDRPKTGFDLPIFDWLKKDLAHLVDDYLSPERLRRSGFLNDRYIAFVVEQFRKDKLHYNNIVWRLIQFQMWYERWMN